MDEPLDGLLRTKSDSAFGRRRRIRHGLRRGAGNGATRGQFASGGIPEVVADGQTGFLVREGDWQSLADKLLVVISDKDLWSKFSKSGQARVRARFDIWKQTSALEGIYDEVLSERSGTPTDRQAQRAQLQPDEQQSLEQQSVEMAAQSAIFLP